MYSQYITCNTLNLSLFLILDYCLLFSLLIIFPFITSTIKIYRFPIILSNYDHFLGWFWYPVWRLKDFTCCCWTAGRIRIQRRLLLAIIPNVGLLVALIVFMTLLFSALMSSLLLLRLIGLLHSYPLCLLFWLRLDSLIQS